MARNSTSSAARSEWSENAEQFLRELPPGFEGAERALKFRTLVADAFDSGDHRLLRAVYELVADGFLPYSLYDARMVIVSVTERLEVLPSVRLSIERFLATQAITDEAARGLWGYVQELYIMGRPGCETQGAGVLARSLRR